MWSFGISGQTHDDIAVPVFGSGVSLSIISIFALSVVYGQQYTWFFHSSQTADWRVRTGISVRSQLLAKHDCDNELKDKSRIVETICKMVAAILAGLHAPVALSEQQ